MGRVVRRAASASASALARRAPSRAVQRRARKHKVIMESVTQEKKKLRSVICFEAQAPSGYTFIPAGNPLLTSTCKERCRKEGLRVYAVSTTPHTNTHDLSQHVHRIGYHFPSTVVATACSELGLYLTSTGKAVPFHTLGTLQNHPPAESEISQVTINTEARDAIKDLFPNIPQHDLFQIIKTAFQRGQRKVGTATELPLARRAQLAVVAHIRHLYTDYDRLLKLKSFHEARSAVEQSTLAKVIEWRGDDENGQTVLEDVFREVIVISDDEDSDTEGVAAADTRDQNGETFSKYARTHEIRTQPVSTAKLSHQDTLREPSEEAPPGFRIVSRMPAKNAIDRRGFSRYQAWNRALNRYRAEAQSAEQARLGDASAEQQSSRYAKRPAAAQEIADPVRRRDAAPQFMDVVHTAASKPTQVDNSAQRATATLAVDRLFDINHVGTQERHYPMEDQRTYPQYGPNGLPLALTIQKPLDVRRLEEPPRLSTEVLHSQGLSHSDKGTNAPFERFAASSNDRAHAPVFVGGPKELHQRTETFESGTRGPIPPRSSPETIPHDYVLPSVETPWPLESRPVDGRLEHLTQRMSIRSVTPVRRQGDVFQHENVSAPDSPNNQNPKRRRLAHYAAPLHDTRPDLRNEKPFGIRVSQGLSPRRQYHRVELAPEPRSQNGVYLDRDYSSAADPPLLVGNHREKKPVVAPQARVYARPASDQMYVAEPQPHVSVHHAQPGLPGASSNHVASGRTFRAADVSRPNIRPAYYGNRSSHVDRAWPSMPEGPRAPLWKPPLDGPRPVTGAPSGGKLYDDGFVRHVDIQEVRPIQYYVQCPGPQTQCVGENSTQAMRTRDPEHFVIQDQSQPHGSDSEQRQPLSPRVSHASHGQTSRRPQAVFGSHQLNSSHRQRRPGSGLSTSRRLRDRRSFQMVEQNRPVYVQRVESQPPPYAVPDGRQVVIVD